MRGTVEACDGNMFLRKGNFFARDYKLRSMDDLLFLSLSQLYMGSMAFPLYQ